MDEAFEVFREFALGTMTKRNEDERLAGTGSHVNAQRKSSKDKGIQGTRC